MFKSQQKNLIPLVANLVSCDVLEYNNTNEQRNFFHALELQSSSLEIFDVNSNAMFEIVVIDVDDECVPLPKIPKKVVTCQLQISKDLGYEYAMGRAHF